MVIGFGDNRARNFKSPVLIFFRKGSAHNFEDIRPLVLIRFYSEKIHLLRAGKKLERMFQLPIDLNARELLW